jgi:hypothetical protein
MPFVKMLDLHVTLADRCNVVATKLAGALSRKSRLHTLSSILLA